MGIQMRIPIEQLQKAVELLKTGAITRIDGNGWIVYKIGKIIRIDLEMEK